MIILESIRLRNFRAIREAVFKPQKSGLIGIFGPNGAGKSTFLAGTLFALFGVKPNGASVASLRRINSAGEECSASVVFKHLNQTVEIIRELKGGNNRVVVDIYVDGVPQTVTSVGAADTWIAQRIGIDAVGFLTAFIVRQKELDALITARPAERKAIIEKLAGIDTINEALKKARKDENTAKAILESLPGSVEKIEEASAQVELLSERVNDLANIKEEKQAELSELQQTISSLSTSLETYRSIESQIYQVRSQISTLEAGMESDQSTILRLEPIVKAGTSFNIEELREAHKAISTTLAEKTQTINSTSVFQHQLATSKESLTATIRELTEQISDTVKYDGALPEIEEKIAELQSDLQKTRNNIAVAANKTEDYKEKIHALQGNHKNCPTCNTALSDVDGLIADFEAIIAEYSDKQITLSSNAIEIETLISAALNEKRSAEAYITAKQDLVNASNELVRVNNEISELPDITSLKKEVEDLESQKETVTENGFKAKQYDSSKVEYETAVSAVKQKTLKLMELEPMIVDLESKFSAEKYNKIRLDVDQKQKNATWLSSKLNEAFSELSSFQSRLGVANNNLRSATEQWNRKKELFKAQERKALTTEVIDKFRQDSIASLAPELSERATELISEITSGAYTEIRLDESFNVTVVNSIGEIRDVSWLSGGEESAVAFSLRLAIAFLITGDNPSLLWLDEVLTAQDGERRASMLSTIRHLPIDQIILINHTADSTDIVDQAVTVVPDIENGSVLVSG